MKLRVEARVEKSACVGLEEYCCPCCGMVLVFCYKVLKIEETGCGKYRRAAYVKEKRTELFANVN